MKDKKQEFLEKIKKKAKRLVKERGLENISDVLDKIRQEYLKGIKDFVSDPQQSWKAFKGKLLEEIIIDEIYEEVERNGLKVIKGSELEKEEKNLDKCLALVKRSLMVDFGEYGMHLPDADLVIYDPKSCKAVAIISSKATLRERVAQVESPVTKNIKVFFITLDEDGDLVIKKPTKKSRAITEVDTDGTFVITNRKIEESNKVKIIRKFFDILKLL
ncbi:MAG: BsaWI family type II restriction enzyme [Candidatus Caldipriscus sp.]|jgi:type II restriction enzyme|nr:BsaWI family type II restriction enzyme [Candidatus Caldipriscus sp.]